MRPRDTFIMLKTAFHYLQMTNSASPFPESPRLTQFINQFGLATEEEGLPRNAGRILALLLLSEAPVSFSDIAALLSSSRGGVSTNTRLLEEMKLVERQAVAGDRQDYFAVPVDIWQNQIRRQMNRDNKVLSFVQAVLDGPDDLTSSARKRLTTLAGILVRSQILCNETLELLNRDEL